MDTPNESDTTQTDVTDLQALPQETTTPESPQTSLAEPVVNLREEAINRIVEMREQGLDDESNESELPDHQGASNTLTVKIDGIEKTIPIEQAKAVIQKNLAADKRLNEAVLKQQELNQWEQQLQTREKKLPVPDEPEITPDNVKDNIQTAVDKLYDGDTDEAVDALMKVVGRNTTTLDTDTISAQATESVMQNLRQREFNTEVEQGKQQFVSEYKNIANDPELYNMADRKTIDLMNTYPSWTPTQIIMEAGRQTQAWVNGINGGVTQPSREARKSQLQSLPRSQGSVAYQAPEPIKGSNAPKDVISDMKQARGQA